MNLPNWNIFSWFLSHLGIDLSSETCILCPFQTICYCYSYIFWIFVSATWAAFVSFLSFLLFCLVGFFFFFYVSEVLPFSLFITVAVRNHPGMLHRMKCLGSVKGISLQRPPALQRASPGPGAGCLCTAMQGGFPFCFGTHGYCDVAESVHFWQ